MADQSIFAPRLATKAKQPDQIPTGIFAPSAAPRTPNGVRASAGNPAQQWAASAPVRPNVAAPYQSPTPQSSFRPGYAGTRGGVATFAPNPGMHGEDTTWGDLAEAGSVQRSMMLGNMAAFGFARNTNGEYVAAPGGVGLMDLNAAHALSDQSRMDPRLNPYLQPQADTAQGLASGRTGATMGGDRAALAADAALRAAGGVRGAGDRARDAQAGAIAGLTQAAGQVQQVGNAGRADQQAAIRAQLGGAQTAAGDLAGLRGDIGAGGLYRQAALGQGPSAAALQGNIMMSQADQAQASQAAMARGGNLASAGRNAALVGTQTRLQGQQQIMAQRAQEQLNGQQLLLGGQQALNAGNAAVGQQLGNTAASAGQLRNQDLAGVLGQTQALGTAVQGAGQLRGQDLASAMAGSQAYQGALQGSTGLMGANLGAVVSGMNGLGNSAGTYLSSSSGVENQNAAERQAYTDMMLRQLSLELGLPAAAMGPNAQMQIANQQLVKDYVGMGLQGLGALGAGAAGR